MYSKYPEHQQNQKGATLIIVLIVVLLVVVIAVRMGSDYLLLFRTVEAQSDLQQSRNYLRGAESLAREALLQDIRLAGEVDTYLELWASEQELVLPEGIMRACLVDLQSRINLNDLATVNDVYSSAQLRFIRLLQTLALDAQLDVSSAQALAHAVFDWADQDNQARYPGGAESVEYMQKTPPYRPANQPFVSVSELRLVAGMTPEIVAALTPYVSVWGNGVLNFNTLDAGLSFSQSASNDETVPQLLRTINNRESLLPISIETAKRLALIRSNQGGFVSDLDFFTRADFAQQNWDIEGLGVRSEFFQLNAEMRVNSRRYFLQSVLHRNVSALGVPTIAVLTRNYSQGKKLEANCAVTME